jgi:very-short-patch-repair endonuclease
MMPGNSELIEVTLAASDGRKKRRGIRIHRSLTIDPGAVTRRSGIPITSPARTLRDLRRTVPAVAFQRAVRRALDLRLVTTTTLDFEPDLTRSELERMFLRLCRRHHLPAPEVNARVGPFEIDFLWRDLSLIVETDGFRYHGGRAAFELDRARDARLQALGYRVVRLTYRQLQESPGDVVAALRSLMRHDLAP